MRPHAPTARHSDFIWASIAAATLRRSSDAFNQRPALRARSLSLRSRSASSFSQSAVRQAAIGAIGRHPGWASWCLAGDCRCSCGWPLCFPIPDVERVHDRKRQRWWVRLRWAGPWRCCFFVGAPSACIGGIAVMAVRPWLPAGPAHGISLTGAIGFAVAGPAVLESGENGDYQRFGILGLNICLFTLLPFLFGIAVLPVIDWLDRRISPRLPGILAVGGDRARSRCSLTAIRLFAVCCCRSPCSSAVGLLLLLPSCGWLSHLARRCADDRASSAAGALGLARPSVLVDALPAGTCAHGPGYRPAVELIPTSKLFLARRRAAGSRSQEFAYRTNRMWNQERNRSGSSRESAIRQT